MPVPSHLSPAAMLLGQVHKVIALQQLVGELCVADARLGADARLNRVLGQHGAHSCVFAHLHRARQMTAIPVHRVEGTTWVPASGALALPCNPATQLLCTGC